MTILAEIEACCDATDDTAMVEHMAFHPKATVLMESATRVQSFRPSIREIQNAVATQYGVTVSDIRSHKRVYSIAHPRQMAMYLARELTDHSTVVIGRAFGGRDHATILHGIRATRNRLDEDLWLHVERQSVLHWLREARRGDAA